MALRVITRIAGGSDFDVVPCATIADVRNAIRDAIKNVAVTDCMAEDDTRTIMSERWFIAFIGRKGFTG